jgi:hypothetical protein
VVQQPLPAEVGAAAVVMVAVAVETRRLLRPRPD